MSLRTATVNASGQRAPRGVNGQVGGTWRVERVEVGRVVLAGCWVAVVHGESCPISGNKQYSWRFVGTVKKARRCGKGKGMARGIPIPGLVQGQGPRNRPIVHRGGWWLVVCDLNGVGWGLEKFLYAPPLHPPSYNRMPTDGGRVQYVRNTI